MLVSDKSEADEKPKIEPAQVGRNYRHFGLINRVKEKPLSMLILL